jgi:hypothetical protein
LGAIVCLKYRLPFHALANDPRQRGRPAARIVLVSEISSKVIVSGFLSPAGPPGRIVEWLRSGAVQAVLDDRMAAEYAEVLARPFFQLPAAEVDIVLAAIRARAFWVEAAAGQRAGGPPGPGRRAVSGMRSDGGRSAGHRQPPAFPQIRGGQGAGADPGAICGIAGEILTTKHTNYTKAGVEFRPRLE